MKLIKTLKTLKIILDLSLNNDIFRDIMIVHSPTLSYVSESMQHCKSYFAF